MLEGVKVLEAASVAAGPVAGAMLAEWGADVVKIEPLEGERARRAAANLGIDDTPFDPDFDLHNRGKRGLAIDLSRPESREIIEALVKGADVFLTNMLPDQQAKLGLDWRRLSELNPKLVYASISGYGTRGPAADFRAVDHTAFWARSGMAHLMALKGEEPLPIRRAMGDRFTGVALTAGVLAAYIEAQRTGRGKLVEASLLRTGMFALGTDLTTQMTRGRVGRSRPRDENVNPLFSFFPTRDGRWMAGHLQTIGNTRFLGHGELATDPRFADPASRRKNAGELAKALDAIFRQHTLAEWCERLRHAPFPWSPVQDAAEAVDDPQARAAGAVVDVPSPLGGHRSIAMPAGFADFDGTPAGLPHGPAPGIGEHTDEVLRGAGFSDAEVARFRAAGVVA